LLLRLGFFFLGSTTGFCSFKAGTELDFCISGLWASCLCERNGLMISESAEAFFPPVNFELFPESKTSELNPPRFESLDPRLVRRSRESLFSPEHVFS
jgi:hypothetical protein